MADKKLIQHEYDKFRKQNILPDISEVFTTAGLGILPFDYMSRAYDSNATETYTLKSGGSSGTTTNTLTIVYTDSSLSTISSITKT